MKSLEEKSTSISSINSANSMSSNNSNSNSNTMQIAVLGLHDVGKSALTVRYLTRRYIGEYKSKTDMLYRQTLAISHGASLDLEIIDISTSTSNKTNANSTEEYSTSSSIPHADAYIIVYSVTDRSSFDYALETVATITTGQPTGNSSSSSISSTESGYSSSTSCSSSRGSTPPLKGNGGSSANTSPRPRSSCPVVLVGNKNDLEHLRVVERMEGLTTALEFGTHFYELSVAENSAEVTSVFQTLISNFCQNHYQPRKRKFSVSKMLGNLRIGRNSPGGQNNQLKATSAASVVDIDSTKLMLRAGSCMNLYESSEGINRSLDSGETSSNNCNNSNKNSIRVRRSSSRSKSQCKSAGSNGNFGSSFGTLKSKFVEFQSLKKRNQSPPVCSL